MVAMNESPKPKLIWIFVRTTLLFYGFVAGLYAVRVMLFGLESISDTADKKIVISLVLILPLGGLLACLDEAMRRKRHR
jgi:hypothetical protein